MNDLDRRPTEFELYGNQPRVHAVAWNVRFEITEARRRTKDARRRSVDVNNHHRVSGRELSGDYLSWNGSLHPGGSHWTNPPKSPTVRWLVASGGYERCPF